jgi:hypothetical protein
VPAGAAESLRVLIRSAGNAYCQDAACRTIADCAPLWPICEAGLCTAVR